MTLFGLLASLAWTALAVLFIARLSALAHRWLSLKSVQSASPVDATVPADLVALAMGESEKWGQESVLATIRERWDLYHDWNKVRAALGVGAID